MPINNKADSTLLFFFNAITDFFNNIFKPINEIFKVKENNPFSM